MKKKSKQKITKNMLLGDVVNNHPKTAQIFFKHGLPCAACGMAFYETIEQGAKVHNIDLKKLLKDLNDAVKN
jgi:hybrid cluster-associated redox disulfide protein